MRRAAGDGAGLHARARARIGVAWQHKDGKGFNIQLECVPLDGRITLRTATEKKDQ